MSKGYVNHQEFTFDMVTQATSHSCVKHYSADFGGNFGGSNLIAVIMMILRECLCASNQFEGLHFR